MWISLCVFFAKILFKEAAMPVTARRVTLALALLLLAVFSLSSVSAAQGEAPLGRRLLLVSVPALSYGELDIAREAGLPHIHYLTQHGTLAAINMRTAGRGLPAAYVALGAGRSATGAQDAHGFSVAESIDGLSADKILSLYIGNQSKLNESSESGVVVPSIRSLDLQNKASLHQAVPGLLGQTLSDAGVRIYIWGNSDLDMHPSGEERSRYLPLMLMDRNGWVKNGAVDGENVLRSDPNRAYGVRMDADRFRMWQSAIPSEASAALIGLEWGDLSRLEKLRGRFDPPQFERIRLEVLSDLDRWLGMLLDDLRQEDSLWLLSPQVSETAWKEKKQLTPLIVYKKGQAGSLYRSESTRRIGVATFADVSATILQELGVQVPQGMAGLPLVPGRVTSGTSWEVLQQELTHIERVYQLRPMLLYSLVTAKTILILAGLGLWIKRRIRWKEENPSQVKRKGRAGTKATRVVLYSLLCIPLALLFAGGMASQGLGWMTSVTLGGIVILGWGAELADAHRGGSAWYGAALISLTTASAILADGLLGAPLMKHSVLGYDPMIGARYYGIGNEYMGTLIGSLLFGSAALLQAARTSASRRAEANAPAEAAPRPRLDAVRAARWRHRLWAAAYAAAFLAVAVWLAAPGGGANAGGALTAVAAFGLAWARFFGGAAVRRLRSRGLALLAAGLLAGGLALLWLVNAAPGTPVTGIPTPEAAPSASYAPAAGAAPPSHIGRAFAKLEQGSFGELLLIVQRKLSMNLHLLRVSIWSKVLIAALLVAAAAAFRPWGALREWQQRYPYLTDGFAAIAWGSVAALLLNDSGIVAAATLLLHAAVPMLMLLLEDAAPYEKAGNSEFPA
jgi:hypothetical protein